MLLIMAFLKKEHLLEGIALGQYIIGDITPSFYDFQKTVYEGTYSFSDFRAGDACL